MAGETVKVQQRTENRKLKAFSDDEESHWNGPFCFIQAADTQLGLYDVHIRKFDEPDVTWSYEVTRTKMAIQAANRMSPRPRFFIVCGDLVNAFPGTVNREAQERDWHETFEELDDQIPLVCVCGNHDLGNTPTASTIQGYVRSFGTDDYFTFWCGGVYNIVLNSQFFEDPSQVQDLADAHLKWIDEQLAHAKSKAATHIFVFQHIPFFLESFDEAKQYFNLDNPFRLTMLDKFESAGVKAIFCGHYHRNGGGRYKGIEEVVTNAVGLSFGENEPSGLRVVNVYQDRFEHKYYPVTDIPLDPGLAEK
ncbi:serine/threonine-protein phosphatase CPPED1 [Galendromus occidentalis]|uniref:Serine/threonine-protein phosphatase CPPED1 n=1 Tax=Galendromus occidentalis TaxID=34638 RepID=A0AAJ6QVN2_9ACAR|nr:serine/threonine-protein phosphatase CPPED1 [Galendromus occidentalis]